MTFLYVYVSILALQIGSSVPFSQISYICINIQYLFFSFWLPSLCMTDSRSSHVSTNDPVSFLFMAESYSIVYIHLISFIHSSVGRHLGCFHVLAVVNRVAVNIGVPVSFWIMVFSGHMFSSGIAGSYGSSVFTVWYSHYREQQYGDSPFFFSVLTVWFIANQQVVVLGNKDSYIPSFHCDQTWVTYGCHLKGKTFTNPQFWLNF